MDQYFKEFNTYLREIDYSRNIANKFSDFLSLSTYSLAQSFYHSKEIEDKYLKIAECYTKEQINTFAKMLTVVVKALEEEMQDFLGQVFMNNDMGADYKGQFFTPYHVSKMMAEIQLIDGDNLNDKEIITVSEPCSGAGGMIIAFAQSMKERGINDQNKLYVEAIDIDDMCFKMTYIQLALLGIPAKVIKGNTLCLEFQEVLYTPFFFLNNIQRKLGKPQNDLENNPSVELKQIENIKVLDQLSLF